jgi:hypothetical protein
LTRRASASPAIWRSPRYCGARRDVGGVMVEYLGKGKDGEDVYRMPAAVLRELAAAKLDEWKGG